MPGLVCEHIQSPSCEPGYCCERRRESSIPKMSGCKGGGKRRDRAEGAGLGCVCRTGDTQDVTPTQQRCSVLLLHHLPYLSIPILSLPWCETALWAVWGPEPPQLWGPCLAQESHMDVWSVIWAADYTTGILAPKICFLLGTTSVFQV